MIDCNTFIGNWAFRRLRHNDAAGLIGMMDQFGIDRACVASADAILYRDCHAGNEKLYEEAGPYGDRLWFYATLNPAYAGWERDLQRCIDLGFKALRLYPYYHGYRLTDAVADPLVAAAGEAGLPVSIPMRVVDVRQRHWMDTTENLDPKDVVTLAKGHPSVRFLITEALFSPGAAVLERMRDLDISVEMSRMTGVIQKTLPEAVEALGAGRVFLGTGFPFKSPSPAFLKIQTLDADDDVKHKIAHENAEKLFSSQPR